MSSKWEEVSAELYTAVVGSTPKERQPLLAHIYAQRICKVDDLIERFPEHGKSIAEMLVTIGNINGMLFSKHNCAIYPKEVASSVGDCAFTLGVLDN